MTHPLARLRGIERRFGSVPALRGADLDLHAGEVHGVLGANGAGKTTLLNILGGMLTPDAGSVEIDGREVAMTTPRDAWAHGVGLVHQHFTLVPALTVLENLALGMGRRSLGSVRTESRRVMEKTGLQAPLDDVVERLGVGDRQRTEILKVLLRDPRLIVLDEPTAVLAPPEIEGLFELLRELAGDGRGVVLVAHKLDEVLGIADRVTVLRDGRSVLTAAPSEHDQATFVRAMVGGGTVDPIALGTAGGSGLPTPVRSGGAGAAPHASAHTLRPARDASSLEVPVASLTAVTVFDGTRRALDSVDMVVHPGEIVGVAGVEGNGQRELALVLAGRLEASEGQVEVPDEVGFVPQDRRSEGLIADFDLTENVALALHRQARFNDGPWLRWAELREAAEAVLATYGVSAPSVDTRASALSGGNQQRVVVGRELALGSRLLVAENPTRGLDVAAASFVHGELRRVADDGIAIVLVSADLDEVLGLADRVCVLTRGTLRALPEGPVGREEVGALMLAVGPS